jgi:hypothetical protein
MDYASPVLSTIDQRRIVQTGAGENDLNIITLPGGVLRNPGDQIIITAAMELAANANNKTTRVYFAGNLVAERGPTADNASTRYHEVTVNLRDVNGLMYAIGRTFNRSTGSWIMSIYDVATPINYQNPIIVKSTGTGIADSDVISRFLKVEYKPVGTNYNLI